LYTAVAGCMVLHSLIEFSLLLKRHYTNFCSLKAKEGRVIKV